MIFHNTKLINLWETAVSLFLFVLLVVSLPRREMQTTSRYASRTSASLGEDYSFIALRFLICIKAGETATATFTIDVSKLKFYNYDLQEVVEPGEFDVMVGPNSRDLKRATITVQ